jgi:hypothetical protein
MMEMIETIERVIKTRILKESLTLIPDKGASLDNIAEEEALVGRKFSIYHKLFLEKWNGIDLEIIRIYCCATPVNRLKRISDEQFKELISNGLMVIGSDPSGFVYLENDKAEIYSLDTDGSEIEFLANNLDIFFADLIFGQNANKFLGDEWKKELINKGIILG